jgi:hypothetical protein
MSSSPNEAPSEGLSLRDELYYEIEGVLQDTKDGAPMDKVCRETLLRVQSRLDSALSATQRSEPDAAALRYLLDSTAPDGQWADQAVHNFVGAMLKQSPPPATPRIPLPDDDRLNVMSVIAWLQGEKRGRLPDMKRGAAALSLETLLACCAVSETPAGGTAKVQEWKEISADKLLGWEEAECEKQELKAVIKSAYLDLAALCPNPSDDDPDFETCLGRRNSADEECLVRAYLALRAMLAAAPSPDGNDQGTGGAR